MAFHIRNFHTVPFPFMGMLVPWAGSKAYTVTFGYNFFKCSHAILGAILGILENLELGNFHVFFLKVEKRPISDLNEIWNLKLLR